jgi:hypothetical protein
MKGGLRELRRVDKNQREIDRGVTSSKSSLKGVQVLNREMFRGLGVVLFISFVSYRFVFVL